MSRNASYQITTSAISCWPFLYKELVLLTLRKVRADHISFHNCHIFLAILIGQLSAKSLQLRQLEQNNTSVHIGRGHEKLQAGTRSEFLECPLWAQAADHRGGSEGTPGRGRHEDSSLGPQLHRQLADSHQKTHPRLWNHNLAAGPNYLTTWGSSWIMWVNTSTAIKSYSNIRLFVRRLREIY